MNEIVNRFLLVGDKIMPETHLKQPGFKDLVIRTQSDKVLKDKTFEISSYPSYNGYQRGLASMATIFLIKNLAEVVSLMNQIINWQMNFINKSLKNFKKEKFIHLL